MALSMDPSSTGSSHLPHHQLQEALKMMRPCDYPTALPPPTGVQAGPPLQYPTAQSAVLPPCNALLDIVDQREREALCSQMVPAVLPLSPPRAPDPPTASWVLPLVPAHAQHSHVNTLPCSDVLENPLCASIVTGETPTPSQVREPGTDRHGENESDNTEGNGSEASPDGSPSMVLDELAARVYVRPRRERKIRVYENPKPSSQCHICARKVNLITCGNLKNGSCLKSVCGRCFEVYRLGVGPYAAVPPEGWLCTHCTKTCPDAARCHVYNRSVERRRQRNAARKFAKAHNIALREPSNHV